MFRGLLVGQLEALPSYLQEEGEDWAEEGGVGEEEGGDMGRVAKGRLVKGKGDGKRSLRNSGKGGEGGERGREQEEEEEEEEVREGQGLEKVAQLVGLNDSDLIGEDSHWYVLPSPCIRQLIRAQYNPTDQSELAMSAADGRQLVGRYLWPDGRQDEADETVGWQRAAKLKLFLPLVPEMLQGWLRGSGGEKGERTEVGGVEESGRERDWDDGEFVQVVQVLAQADALDPQSSTLTPLEEIAAKVSCDMAWPEPPSPCLLSAPPSLPYTQVRRVNELWIAVALSHPSLPRLSPPAIVGCCAALVSEGMRMRTGNGSSPSFPYKLSWQVREWVFSPSFPYKPSWEVQEWVYEAEERRDWLMQLQLAAKVAIPADLDTQFVGVVEAWAQDVTWRQLIADCAGLDEGDIARLLRRTIDILSQIPYLPGIDPSLAKAAKQPAYVMERPPISELIG
ncbi:unnamed protein product [Closterium sp. NIES-64]|nr:unnamed protein product [Closterium sp. NIES-64]